METLSKSAIFEKVRLALNNSENLEEECILKNTERQLYIRITFKPQETFVDEQGIKWVRA
jgi:hypothetical protein